MEKEAKFFDFIKRAHEGQSRRCTGEPYYDHAYRVFLLVKWDKELPDFAGFIALGHDLLEDTNETAVSILRELRNIGLSEATAKTIVLGISGLTNEFTKEKYPELNRHQRKILEIQRLAGLADYLQSIKLYDRAENLLNMSRVHEFNLANPECRMIMKFSHVYAKEGRELFNRLTKATETSKKYLEEILNLYKV